MSSDQSQLKKATGFWSKKELLLNTGTDVVLLRADQEVAAILDFLNAEYERRLRPAVAQRVERCLALAGGDFAQMLLKNPSFRNGFQANDLEGFKARRFRSNWNQVMWSKILDYLEETYPRDPSSQKEAIIDEIVRSHRLGEGMPIAIKSQAISWLHLSLPYFRAVVHASHSFAELVQNMCTLRQFTWNYHKKSRDWALDRNKEVLDRCRTLQLPFAEMRHPTDSLRALALANGCTLALTLLAHREYLLLPSRSTSFLVAACRLIDTTWDWDTLPPNPRIHLSTILASSTVRTIQDVPENVRQWMEDCRFGEATHGLFKKLVVRAQVSDPSLPPWPMAELHGLKRKARVGIEGRWSTPNIARDYGPAWARFAEIRDNASEVSPQHNGAAYRHLLPWAAERGFLSPTDIEPTDLDDPFDPTRSDTFRAYLVRPEKLSITTGKPPATAWTAPALAFALVCNALKLRPDPTLPLKDNPFGPLENPFRLTKPSKTTRHRLPTAIHEAMIDVLLDCDIDGVPTYRWAREGPAAFDLFEWFGADGKAPAQTVWCPSRCAMLALLLMIPIRGKQARWLDRGLMDKRIWNIDRHVYEENQHPLASWRYPDGETQAERFGRASGVLQPIADSVLDLHEIGLFVNTNKTQMWDPLNRRGYEIPWPFTANESGEPEARAAGRWLNRPYEVLFQQIKWMDKYAPNPLPVSFMDSTSEQKHVNRKVAERLPMFTPVFADLSADAYRNDAAHTRIHLPAQPAKIYRLFSALSLEVEIRLAAEGRPVTLTTSSTSNLGYQGRASVYQIHGLRVAGISRLIEMGVPVSIVQEFIAGHATAVMTLYYAKSERAALKEKLTAAFAARGVVDSWESLRPALSSATDLWVGNPRYRSIRDDRLMEQYSGWRTVPGGICPLGGTACHMGGVPVGDGLEINLGKYEPVNGGCGNCRFFSTGPAFLIQQAQAMNELMLELRMHGRSRKSLYGHLSELAWTDTKELQSDQRRKLAFDRQVIKEQISTIDQRCEPLVLEWFNRYMMFEESSKLLDRWKQFEKENRSNDARLALLAAADGKDIRDEINVRLQRGGEFSLVRGILDSANIQGGLARASQLSKDRCCEFMDRILRHEASEHLLMDIPDASKRHEAAWLMANMVEQLAGATAVQACIDDGTPLPIIEERRAEFRRWTSHVLGESVPSASRVESSGTKRSALYEQKDHHAD
ncbi:VPA1269 family protein [Paraburkholderia dipogonis]|uniref:VPA1269 family protein n=1 Tax=Paraburkholderia dipogonis TaxID=1211383 RepID=UPI00141B9301|nr:VPA1269 family protein [Paraburkholderia dipogonis]